MKAEFEELSKQYNSSTLFGLAWAYCQTLYFADPVKCLTLLAEGCNETAEDKPDEWALAVACVPPDPELAEVQQTLVDLCMKAPPSETS